MEMTGDWIETGGRAIAQTSGREAVAFVDGHSGQVLEALRIDRLPSEAGVSVDSAAAQRSAADYLVDAGLAAAVSSVSVRHIDRAGAGAFEADWTPADGSTPYRVFVNATTAEVFGFAALNDGALAMPVIGRSRAIELAVAELGVPGETVTSAELTVDCPAGDSPKAIWAIGLGVPTATQADVFENGAYVTVDAVTGQATIVKK